MLFSIVLLVVHTGALALPERPIQVRELLDEVSNQSGEGKLQAEATLAEQVVYFSKGPADLAAFEEKLAALLHASWIKRDGGLILKRTAAQLKEIRALHSSALQAAFDERLIANRAQLATLAPPFGRAEAILAKMRERRTHSGNREADDYKPLPDPSEQLLSGLIQCLSASDLTKACGVPFTLYDTYGPQRFPDPAKAVLKDYAEVQDALAQLAEAPPPSDQVGANYEWQKVFGSALNKSGVERVTLACIPFVDKLFFRLRIYSGDGSLRGSAGRIWSTETSRTNARSWVADTEGPILGELSSETKAFDALIDASETVRLPRPNQLPGLHEPLGLHCSDGLSALARNRRKAVVAWLDDRLFSAARSASKSGQIDLRKLLYNVDFTSSCALSETATELTIAPIDPIATELRHMTREPFTKLVASALTAQEIKFWPLSQFCYSAGLSGFSSPIWARYRTVLSKLGVQGTDQKGLFWAHALAGAGLSEKGQRGLSSTQREIAKVWAQLGSWESNHESHLTPLEACGLNLDSQGATCGVGEQAVPMIQATGASSGKLGFYPRVPEGPVRLAEVLFAQDPALSIQRPLSLLEGTYFVGESRAYEVRVDCGGGHLVDQFQERALMSKGNPVRADDLPSVFVTQLNAALKRLSAEIK